MDEHHLVLDTSNLLYRTFYANKDESAQDITGLAMHSAFTTMNKYYKKFRPNKIIMAFDRKNWRKEYTLSEECYSKKIYKGERRKDQTPAQKQKYADFMGHINEFEKLIRTQSSIICLAKDGLEGDDGMGGWIQAHPDVMHTAVSGDHDIIQLLKHDNVRLFDPATGKERICEDPEYFLFLKCFRGEPASTDNVQSAYPNLRETRILAAYKDPFALTNLRQSTWMNADGREMNVGKLLDENRLLIDLECQPVHIRQSITDMIEEAKQNVGKFSYFNFMKFLGQYELKKLAQQLDQFAGMLSR